MQASGSYLQELDEAIARGTGERRLKALWHVTDLLISGHYSDEDIWVFGEVIQRLAQEIEAAARAKLSAQLAEIDRAPPNAVRDLAFDESIDVAGPVLRNSAALNTATLVANAKTKGQQHLLAIAQRKSLDSRVTDILVVRGDKEVANTVTRNSGAAFSNPGFLHLLKRSEKDSILMESLGSRTDIPRPIFQQLIAKASHEVRQKLLHTRPNLEDSIAEAVTDVTSSLHVKFGPASKEYFVAKRLVGLVYQQGRLTEAKVAEYALTRKIDEAVVALSMLCQLPVNVTERALKDDSGNLLLVLAKGIGFSWQTTMSLLFLRAPDHRIATSVLEARKREFEAFSRDSAFAVLQFYQSRKEHDAAQPARHGGQPRKAGASPVIN